MDAYVEGRPTPRRSNSRTKVATLYRAGGAVWWDHQSVEKGR